ncbi:hypothetical protein CAUPRSCDRAFT_11341 [Caulochytrium protostelioides]|uniref:RRM domain-containing protein n=1 Tax=Caulochytrium protostelioides TaxID=1555241 RepID=A0A4P9WXA9_9FUNG|nr:hypothetical protein CAUPRSCDRAFT_11341 [Caulochytrium protostelioides]
MLSRLNTIGHGSGGTGSVMSGASSPHGAPSPHPLTPAGVHDPAAVAMPVSTPGAGSGATNGAMDPRYPALSKMMMMMPPPPSHAHLMSGHSGALTPTGGVVLTPGGKAHHHAGYEPGIATVGTPGPGEDVTTIFVIGFPDDITEREFQNMFTFAPGFEAAILKIPSAATNHMSYAQSGWNSAATPSSVAAGDASVGNDEGASGSGAGGSGLTTHPTVSTPGGSAHTHGAKRQIIGFAKFRNRILALEARDVLNGRRLDPDRACTLKADMAKKNLHPKRHTNMNSSHNALNSSISGPHLGSMTQLNAHATSASHHSGHLGNNGTHRSNAGVGVTVGAHTLASGLPSSGTPTLPGMLAASATASAMDAATSMNASAIWHRVANVNMSVNHIAPDLPTLQHPMNPAGHSPAPGHAHPASRMGNSAHTLHSHHSHHSHHPHHPHPALQAHHGHHPAQVEPSSSPSATHGTASADDMTASITSLLGGMPFSATQSPCQSPVSGVANQASSQRNVSASQAAQAALPTPTSTLPAPRGLAELNAAAASPAAPLVAPWWSVMQETPAIRHAPVAGDASSLSGLGSGLGNGHPPPHVVDAESAFASHRGQRAASLEHRTAAGYGDGGRSRVRVLQRRLFRVAQRPTRDGQGR